MTTSAGITMTLTEVDLEFSGQATVLVKNMPSFDYKKFKEFLETNGVPVGAGMIMEFLLTQEQEEKKNGS